MPGFFRQHASKLSVGLVGSGADQLRDAQRGAIWALASHWTASGEPAQVALPTGVGKTLVLTAAPFLFGARRVLVVAPSRVVREQLEDAFRSLNGLKRTDALPYEVPEPKVITLRGKATRKTWREAHSADVVVANVHGVSPTFTNVTAPDANLFDLVLVDEGHHVPAPAWRSLLEACQARMVFVTATPFRRDRRPIPGEIVYSYPLEKAISDSVYTPVSFRAVNPESDEDKDVVLAAAAAARLGDASHRQAGSRLLVRAGRVAHAEQLVEIYRTLGVKLGLVVAKTSWRGLQKIFAAVRNGDLDGIACVGALTEGFDMPELRIAAYHEPHKTLAPTLQFIGRLSRPGLEVSPELLAVPRDVGPETDILYREDRSWQELLPGLVDGLIEEERQVRRYLNNGTWEPSSLRLPPLAIRPGRSARIFHADQASIDLNVSPTRLGGADVVWRFHSADSGLLALVTQHPQRPRWLDDEMLDASTFELHLACFIAGRSTLFIASDVTSCLRDLRDKIGADSAIAVDGEELRRLAWKIAPDAWFSIGMRPTRITGAAYEQSAGPRVENALGEDRLRGHSLGHGMAGGAGRGTFGFSVQKAKLWEPEATGSLYEFRRWCEERAEDLATAARDTRGLPGLPAMSVATQFTEFPQVPVIAALMEHTLIGEQAPLVDAGRRLFLHELELWADAISPTELRLEVKREEELLWSAIQDPSGGIRDAQGSLEASEPGTGQLWPLSQILIEYPPIIHFSDGSSVQGRHLDRPHSPHRPVADGTLEAWDWAGTDVRRETGDIEVGAVPLQTRVAEILAQQSDIVLTDHGPGEVCDLIGLARIGQPQVEIRLIHCKAAAAATPRRQLLDINEVLTQAARSARWADPAAGLWAELNDRRTRRPAYFRILHDPENQASEIFKQFMATPPSTQTTIYAVQPGLAIHRVSGWTEGESLINVASDWCRFGRTEFRLVGS
jgi:superfamily II DNA or RNA helicase